MAPKQRCMAPVGDESMISTRDTVVELKQLRSSLNTFLKNQKVAATAQGRSRSIQSALCLAGSHAPAFVYYSSKDGYSPIVQEEGTELIQAVLMNALRGEGTELPKNAVADPSGTGADFRWDTMTTEGFRQALSGHVHSLTGIKPKVQLDKKAGSYVMSL